MGERRLFLKSGISGIVLTGITRFISFLYVVAIAKLFLPADIGTFYLVVSILAIVNMFSDLGVASTLTRYLPFFEGKNERQKMKKTIELISVCGISLAAILSILLFILAEPIAGIFGIPEAADSLRLACPYLVLLEITLIGKGLLNSKRKLYSAPITNVLIVFFKLSITILLFYILGGIIEVLILGLLFSTFLGGIYSTIKGLKCVSEELSVEKERFSLPGYLEFGKEIFAFGIVVSSLGVLGSLMGQVNQVMIGGLAPGDALTQVAIFAIVISFGTLLNIFPKGITRLLLPISSGLYRKGKLERIRELADLATRSSLIITLPPAIVFIVFSKELLSLFYGAAYISGGVVLASFSMMVLIRILTSSGRVVLSAMKLVGLEFRIVVAAFVVLVGLNFILVPTHGMDGAAISMIISTSIASSLNYYYSRKVYGFRLFSGYLKVFLAGILLLVVLMYSKGGIWGAIEQYSSAIDLPNDEFGLGSKLAKVTSLAILFGASFAIYALLLQMMGGFGKNEKKAIKLIIDKLKQIKIA